MQTAEVTAANGGFQPTITFVSGVDSEGAPHEYGNLYATYRCNAAVARGDALSWVNPTATNPVSVTPMATATSSFDFAGIAMESRAAGQYVRVCITGFCLVDMVAQTAAAGEVITKPATTAGKVVRAAAPTVDAALVATTVLGRVFGIKNATTNLALCFIKQM